MLVVCANRERWGGDGGEVSAEAGPIVLLSKEISLMSDSFHLRLQMSARECVTADEKFIATIFSIVIRLFFCHSCFIRLLHFWG